MSGDLTLYAIILAGMLSFISPCVLPLVPPYLTYLAGVSLDEVIGNEESAADQSRIRRKALINAVFFVLGFTTVFVALGAGASSFSYLIRQYQDQLAVVAGIVIILMGCHLAQEQQVLTLWAWPSPLVGHPALAQFSV